MKRKQHPKSKRIKELQDAIDQQLRDLKNDNRIEQHRDNETNRKLRGLPRRKRK